VWTNEIWRPPFQGNGSVRYYSLARHALIEAFRIAGVHSGCRILLPQYLCRDVLSTLHLLGAHPCWYPVTPDMLPATTPEYWPAADCVLAVNYFGFPQDLAPFQAYAERTRAIVIEDNSHGYLSCDSQGEWLGCRTSLGVFSFRKTFRIPDGAALWSGASLSALQLPIQVPLDGAGVNSAQLFKGYIRRLPLVGELAYRLTIGLVRAIRKCRSKFDIQVFSMDSEMKLPASASAWSGLLPALAAVDEKVEIERRREAYIHCAAYGAQAGVVPVFSELPSHCAPYGYAFRGDSLALARMHRYASNKGFDVVGWPDLPSAIINESPLHYRNVFLVNFLW
jgi:hypothetical protein